MTTLGKWLLSRQKDPNCFIFPDKAKSVSTEKILQKYLINTQKIEAMEEFYK